MSKNIHLRSRKALLLDRALSGGVLKQLVIYLLIVVVAFFLLFAIALLLRIRLTNAKIEGFGDFWTMLFFFYDGGLEGTTSSNRLFVYLVNIIGSILMGGILIATLTNYILSNRDKAENGLLRYRLSGHTVFIGFHEATLPLVRKVLERKETALILSEQPYAEVKDRISAGLNAIDSDKLIIYHGNRDNVDDLDSLCLKEAKEVFVFPESLFPDTDSVNLEVVEQISKICKGRTTKLKCTSIFHQNSVVTCFERSDVDEAVKEVLNFTPVIYGDAISRALLSGVYGENLILDRGGITADSDKSVHLFIIGLGDIGQALFAQAVRQLHFPNFNKAKSAITLVGEQSDFNALKSRYRDFFAVADKSETFAYLGDLLDLSVDTVLGENVRELDSALTAAAENAREIVTVAVCLEKSAEALGKAISLPRTIYERHVPIWLYKPSSDSLIDLIKKTGKDGSEPFYSNIYLFGDPEYLVIEDPDYLTAAQRCNWVYDVYRESGRIPEALPSDDEWAKKWKPKWDALSIRNKWSNLNAAYAIPVKQRSLCDVAEEGNSDLFYRVEHNRWVTENLLGGYRPPTISERQEMELDRSKKSTFKKMLVHLDLCAFDDLLPDEYGADVREYDKAMVDSIPLISAKVLNGESALNCPPQSAPN